MAQLAAFALLAAFAATVVQGAGNEDDVLLTIPGEVSMFSTDTIKYYCTYRNLWTPERHPTNYPVDQARWTGPILWTHTTEFVPWRDNWPASRGIEKIAEEGFTDLLIQEMEQ